MPLSSSYQLHLDRSSLHSISRHSRRVLAVSRRCSSGVSVCSDVCRGSHLTCHRVYSLGHLRQNKWGRRAFSINVLSLHVFLPSSVTQLNPDFATLMATSSVLHINVLPNTCCMTASNFWSNCSFSIRGLASYTHTTHLYNTDMISGWLVTHVRLRVCVLLGSHVVQWQACHLTGISRGSRRHHSGNFLGCFQRVNDDVENTGETNKLSTMDALCSTRYRQFHGCQKGFTKRWTIFYVHIHPSYLQRPRTQICFIYNY